MVLKYRKLLSHMDFGCYDKDSGEVECYLEIRKYIFTKRYRW